MLCVFRGHLFFTLTFWHYKETTLEKYYYNYKFIAILIKPILHSKGTNLMFFFFFWSKNESDVNVINDSRRESRKSGVGLSIKVLSKFNDFP